MVKQTGNVVHSLHSRRRQISLDNNISHCKNTKNMCIKLKLKKTHTQKTPRFASSTNKLWWNCQVLGDKDAVILVPIKLAKLCILIYANIWCVLPALLGDWDGTDYTAAFIRTEQRETWLVSDGRQEQDKDQSQFTRNETLARDAGIPNSGFSQWITNSVGAGKCGRQAKKISLELRTFVYSCWTIWMELLEMQTTAVRFAVVSNSSTNREIVVGI